MINGAKIPIAECCTIKIKPNHGKEILTCGYLLDCEMTGMPDSCAYDVVLHFDSCHPFLYVDDIRAQNSTKLSCSSLID